MDLEMVMLNKVTQTQKDKYNKFFIYMQTLVFIVCIYTSLVSGQDGEKRVKNQHRFYMLNANGTYYFIC